MLINHHKAIARTEPAIIPADLPQPQLTHAVTNKTKVIVIITNALSAKKPRVFIPVTNYHESMYSLMKLGSDGFMVHTGLLNRSK